MIFHITIFDSDLNNLAALKAVFADAAAVEIVQVDSMLYSKPPKFDIDVLYLPLAAAERWGSKPLIHESQVLATTEEDQREGFPPFIVTGTCMAPGDPRGPVPETTLLLTSAFDAIRSFNAKHDREITRIGFWGYNVLKGVGPAQLKDIVFRVVPELKGENSL